jgi:hypothetical protein
MGECNTWHYIDCGQPWNCGLSVCNPATGFCESHPDACNDGNACTTDSCSGMGYCVHETDTCDDQDACTTDTCLQADGSCTHASVQCDDSPPCTTDSCAAESGCEYVPLLECDDSNACTADSLQWTGASCACLHAAISCDDANTCTADSCDPATGCAHVSGQSCDDSIPCTLDSCSGSTCVNSWEEAALEVHDVRFPDRLTLTWAPLTEDATVYYRVVSGNIGAPVGAGLEACFGPTELTELEASESPYPGQGWWFVVAAELWCGTGGYGWEGRNGAQGNPRVSAQCP